MPIYEYQCQECGKEFEKLVRSISSCPLAVPLALQIKEAVAQVEGVTGQEVEVVGYVGARALNALLEEGEKN